LRLHTLFRGADDSFDSLTLSFLLLINWFLSVTTSLGPGSFSASPVRGTAALGGGGSKKGGV